MKLIRTAFLCFIALNTNTVVSAQGYNNFKFTFTSSGKIIKNKFTDLNIWDYSAFWDYKNPDEKYFNKNFPYIEYVQLMTATGGTISRDLFTSPEDRRIINDYDASKLIEACRNITLQGLKPYIVTGNVPLKLSTQPIFGEFGVNITPPDNYDEYYKYINFIAATLVETFGLQKVKQWRWGVLTEYENAAWFRSASGTPESSKLAYFKLYDYTVAALQDAIGEANLTVGAHSMTTIPGLWNELDFIDHCAKGVNNKTGKVGTQVNFLTTSFYDPSPGKFARTSLEKCIKILKQRAESNGLKLVYGVDEGRILNGPDGRPLTSRAIQLSFQAAYDANIFKKMVKNDIAWFATWSLTSEGIWSGLPTVSSNFARLGYKMVNDHLIEPLITKSDTAGLILDGLAGYNPAKHTSHVMVYAMDSDFTNNRKKKVKIVLNNLKAVAGKTVIIRKYVIDDQHSNWWPLWAQDKALNNISDQSLKKSVSSFSVEVPWIIINPEHRRVWLSRQSTYLRSAQLNSIKSTGKVINDTITFLLDLQINSVVFFEIENVQLKHAF